MKFIQISVFILIFCVLSLFAQNAASSPNTTDEVSEKTKNLPKSESNETDSKVTLPTDSPFSYVGKDAPVKIPRLETPPVIDGKLDDAVWKTAAVFGDFLQVQPGDNVAPTHPTEFMMGYDAKNLYLAFRVKQDKNTIRATVARRDQIFNDDYIGVFLDTFNDQRQAYIFFFNPLGVQGDGTQTEGRGEDYSIDLVYESKGVLTEDGFTIEAAIPFKSLRYEAGKNKNWGIHIFRRVKYKNNELDSWKPMNRSISGMLNQTGKITGLEGIETTRQLEINPSVTLSESGRRTRYTFDGDPSGRYVNDGLKGEFGMTAKFGLTPTITLDFAYNPDFAQVEADAPVSTANVRFPIFFQEKRPFFLERIDIFQSGLNLVNTRAIVDPDIAAKLTGRRGKNTFGLLYASDNAPGNYSKDERQGLINCLQDRNRNPTLGCGSIEKYVDKNADIGVLRFKRDVGRENNIGFFATTYNFPDRHNNTAAVDGRFRFTKKVVSDFQIVGTTSRRYFYDPDQNKSIYRTGNGVGYRAWIERADRNLYMNYLAMGRSRDYRADVGFTNRTDTNYLGAFVRYQTDRNPKKFILSKRISTETNINYDWKGRLQNFQSNNQGMLAFQREIYVGGGVELGYERVFEHEFGARRNTIQNGAFFGADSERSANRKELYGFIEATPFKQLFFFTVLSFSKGNLDYDFGAGPKYPRVSAPYLAWQKQCSLVVNCTIPEPGLDPGAGDQLYIESTVRYQPTSAWQAQVNYTRRKLTRNDTGLVAFDDNIVSFRSTYQFSRDFFARVRIDYSNISSRVRPNVIFGWTPSPGKAFYVGYNDDLNYNGYNPYSGLRESGFRGNGRTFFIKASYLFKKSF